MILAVASEQNSSDANAYGAVLWKMESQFFTARPIRVIAERSNGIIGDINEKTS